MAAIFTNLSLASGLTLAGLVACCACCESGLMGTDTLGAAAAAAPFSVTSDGADGRELVLQINGESSLLLILVDLTLKVLNFWKLISYCNLKPLW